MHIETLPFPIDQMMEQQLGPCHMYCVNMFFLSTLNECCSNPDMSLITAMWQGANNDSAHREAAGISAHSHFNTATPRRKVENLLY